MSVSKSKRKATNATKTRSSRANPRKRKASSRSKSVKASVAASRNRSAPSKQDALLALLQRPKAPRSRRSPRPPVGNRIRSAAFCPAWKKLKLKVESRKDGSDRTYRIKGRTSS
jgi:hypothetical protein